MPAQVARHRPGLQRRRLGRLAELAALVVADRAAEVLGLADDRRVRHARQAVAHLDRDRGQRAADDGGVIGSTSVVARHRLVPPACGRGSTTPVGLAVAAQPGGTTTVVSRCRGWRRARRPARRRRGARDRRAASAARRARPSTRQVATGPGRRAGRRAPARRRCARASGAAPRRDAHVDDLDRVVERVPVLLAVPAWKRRERRLGQRAPSTGMRSS